MFLPPDVSRPLYKCYRFSSQARKRPLYKCYRFSSQAVSTYSLGLLAVFEPKCPVGVCTRGNYEGQVYPTKGL